MRRLPSNEDGLIELLLLVILAIVALVALLGGFLFIAFSTKALITVVLVGLGVFLFVRPAGLVGNMRLYIPLGLILLGILFYAGLFDKVLG